MSETITAAPSTESAKPAARGIQRETAHRVFALEFNASRQEIKGQGEKDASYLVTPLGAKINRLHVVGVCTDIEPVGESGEVWRARISDPTGVFTVYAGNYQPEAAQALSQLKPPQYVAITGKARSYEPEPGSVFVSIANRHKRAMIFPVKRLADLGFRIYATVGTADVLRRNGIEATPVRKISEREHLERARGLIARLYEELIETSIAHEFVKFDNSRG